MENQKNNSEKSIDGLKNDSVHGDAIKGGGSAVGNLPHLPPGFNGPAVVVTTADVVQDILPNGDVAAVDVSNGGVILPDLGYGDDGNIITTGDVIE